MPTDNYDVCSFWPEPITPNPRSAKAACSTHKKNRGYPVWTTSNT